jgi:hypothetical protein
MRRRVNLQSFAFGTSGNAIIPMNGLPAEDRLIRVDLHMPFAATQGGAGAIVTGGTIQRLIDRVVQGRRINGVSGQGLNALAWAQSGRDPSICADIPVPAGAYDRILNLALHWADYDSADPTDTAALCAMFKDTELVINFGSVVALMPTLTGIVGTLRATAVVEKAPKGAIATPVLLDEYEQSGELNLPPGNYTHLVAFKPDGTPFTSAELASVTVYLDSVPYIDSQTIAQLAAGWNQDKAVGGDTQALSATVPVAGEAITEQPGVGLAAGPAVSVGPFLPLLVPPHRYSITKPFRVEGKLRVVWTGTATTLRVVARRLEELSDDQVVRAAAKAGLPARSAVAKTISASDLTSDKPAWARRLMPRLVA